jgi:hypothetical protein
MLSQIGDGIGALGVGGTVAGETLACLGNDSLTPGFFPPVKVNVFSEEIAMMN